MNLQPNPSPTNPSLNNQTTTNVSQLPLHPTSISASHQEYLAPQLSPSQIEQNLNQFGFPTMRNLLRIAEHLPQKTTNAEENQVIELKLKAHTNNYFGHPKIVIPATAALSALTLFGYEKLVGISVGLSAPLAATRRHSRRTDSYEYNWTCAPRRQRNPSLPDPPLY